MLNVCSSARRPRPTSPALGAEPQTQPAAPPTSDEVLFRESEHGSHVLARQGREEGRYIFKRHRGGVQGAHAAAWLNTAGRAWGGPGQ
jgi:hypothetical protein